MDPSTKGLTTEITAAGPNRQPKQTQHCLLLTAFHSRPELSDGLFSRLNWFQRRTLPQQMAVEFTVRALFSDTAVHFYCQLGGGGWGGGFFPWKGQWWRGYTSHLPSLLPTLAGTFSLLRSLCFSFVLSLHPFSPWPLHTHNRGTICFSEWICLSRWASERTGPRMTEWVHTRAHALPETHL